MVSSFVRRCWVPPTTNSGRRGVVRVTRAGRFPGRVSRAKLTSVNRWVQLCYQTYTYQTKQLTNLFVMFELSKFPFELWLKPSWADVEEFCLSLFDVASLSLLLGEPLLVLQLLLPVTPSPVEWKLLPPVNDELDLSVEWCVVSAEAL